MHLKKQLNSHRYLCSRVDSVPVPNLTVLAPRDIGELQAMTRWSVNCDGPCVIRYGRTSVDLSVRYQNGERFIPGKWETLETGDACTILAVGSMVETAIAVRDMLAKQGIQARLVNCASVKPMDEAILWEITSGPVFTLEEHVRTGGFGAAVCSFYAKEKLPAPAQCFALPDAFITHGSRVQLLDDCGLSAQKIAGEIVKTLQHK